MVKSSLVPFVRWKGWHGRAGGLLLSDGADKRMLVVTVHAPHGVTPLQEFFTDVSALITEAPRGVPLVILGDFNTYHTPPTHKPTREPHT